MRRALAGGAGLCAAALLACASPAAPSSSLTLLFLRRSPAASLGGLSWAPDPDHSRLVALDGQLRVARSFTSPRLANPVAVAALDGELLVSERTGEGVVFDTTGRPVREWDSPNLASLYAAHGTEVVAVRSPYYIPQFAADPAPAPLIRVLDTLGRPAAGLATIHVPPVPYLAQLVNAGAVALGPDGSVYFAPLVRDEIRKYGPGGALRWTAKRGLFRTEPDPEFLPPTGGTSGTTPGGTPPANAARTPGPAGGCKAPGPAAPAPPLRSCTAGSTAKISRSSPSRTTWIAVRWRRSYASIARRFRSWWAGDA